MSYSDVVKLKQQIAETTDQAELVQLYEQLVPMLKEPRPRIRDLSPAERAEHRAKNKALREAGINVRTGKPWTDEQRAKQAAYWTPERRAEAAAKAKGRPVSPEALTRIREAAQARKDKQRALEARLKELEAIVAGHSNGEATAEEAEGNRASGRKGKRQ